MKKRISKIYH